MIYFAFECKTQIYYFQSEISIVSVFLEDVKFLATFEDFQINLQETSLINFFQEV